MKQLQPILFAAMPMLALAACDSQTPETAPDAAETTATPPAASTASPAAPAPLPTTIPATFQGRWGMVPADCEPGRADAKGLLIINGTELEFYESVGTLAAVTEAGATRIRANFDFTGEGMEWKREVTLDAQDDGRTLIRREYGADAAPGPFRYAKCD